MRGQSVKQGQSWLVWCKVTRAEGNKSARQVCKKVWMGRREKTLNEVLREGSKQQAIWLSGAKAMLEGTTFV